MSIENNPTASASGRYKRKKYSNVWKYFENCRDKNVAKCTTCSKEYKTSGNTNNLFSFHPNVNITDQQQEQQNIDTGRRSISPYLKNSQKNNTNSQRKKETDIALTMMIATELQPFSNVNDESFKAFVELLDPKYELPNKTNIRDKLMKDKFLEMQEALKNILLSTEYIAVTCDSWTLRVTEGYLTVKCHFISNFQLKYAVLSTKSLSEA